MSLFLCGTTLVTSSCGDDEVEDFIETINLVGTWKEVDLKVTPDLENPEMVEFGEFATITFNSDFTYSVTNGETGTWQLKDKTITTKWTNHGETGESSCQIDSFDRNQFVVS